jgi:PknH-like extracellular domain
MSRRTPAIAVVVAAAVLTGCATTVPGQPVAGEEPRPSSPPVTAGALEELLLNEAEINKAMGAAEMTVLETSKQMWDSSKAVSRVECLGAFGAAEYEVYTGSGWSAVRYSSLQEPGDDPPHFAEQAVVLFPSRDVAAKFFEDSAQAWARCANSGYSFKLPEWPVPAQWTVSDVANAGGMLSTSMVMEDGDGWGCGRALMVGNNVVIDVSTCSYNDTGAPHVTIAQNIAAKLPEG